MLGASEAVILLIDVDTGFQQWVHETIILVLCYLATNMQVFIGKKLVTRRVVLPVG